MNRAQYPQLTDQQYRDNKKFLQKLHIANGDLDEDTPDMEGMAMRYDSDPADYEDDTGNELRDYQDEAVRTLNSK